MWTTRHETFSRVLHLVLAVLLVLGLCTPLLSPQTAVAQQPPVPGERQPRPTPDVAEPTPAPGGEDPTTLDEEEASSSEPSTEESDTEAATLAATLAVSADPAEVTPGDQVTLTVRVEAQGDLGEPTVTGELEKGLEFVSASDPAAQYDSDTRFIRWSAPKLATGEVAEWQLVASLAEDAPETIVQRFELRAQDSPAVVSAQVQIARRYPMTEGLVTAEQGGTLHSADGRVTVHFPAGAVDQAVRVEHRPLEKRTQVGSEHGMALKFELNAYTNDEKAAPVTRFAQPLEVRVDLTGLVDLTQMPYYQYAFVGYWDEEKGQWVELPTEREGQVLIATTDHFTVMGGGTINVVETGWVLTFNDAQVSTFTGGLSYNYPLQVPGGRKGLAPDLSLSYNSRRVDGILTWIQTDWAGLGWTLDTMEIVRKVHPVYNDTDHDGKPDWYYEPARVNWENKFTLLYQGSSFELQPAQTTNPYGRYYTKDEQFLYIERRNGEGGNGSPVNRTSEYWIVRLKDGTQYRLGYNEDSEQTVPTQYQADGCSNCNWQGGTWSGPACCYGGEVDNVVTFRWRVDEIRDRSNNWIEYSYAEEVDPNNTDRERASYLDQIRYNPIPNQGGGFSGAFRTYIDFEREDRGQATGYGDEIDDDHQVSDYYYFYQDQFLRSIKISDREGANYRVIREYLLKYDELTSAGHDNQTRLLASVTEYGRDGISGNHPLPATTLNYTVYQNKNVGSGSTWELECFRYERLTQVNNGYGGRITVSYNTPDSLDDHAYNYRVTAKTLSDNGVNQSQTTYTYPTSNSDRGYLYGENFQVFPVGEATGGNLLGYKTVTEYAKTGGGTTLSSVYHEFEFGATEFGNKKLGRETISEVRNASGHPLGKTVTTWVSEELSNERWFVYASWVEEYTATVTGTNPPALPGTPQKKTRYLYETSYQSGGQYGNVTHVWEYNGTTLYRETRNSYYPNTTDWIVGLTALTEVYGGSSNLQAKTAYLYDGNDYGVQPTRGNLTALKKIQDASAPDTFTTVQTISYNGTYYYLPTQTADGNTNVTQTTYDSEWLYPVTVTQAPSTLNLSTSYVWDKVLDKVTQVTGPNGAATAVSYEYDYWGRLTKIIRPGDTSDYTVSYTYDVLPSWPYLRIRTEQRMTSGGAVLPSWVFYDGLGRARSQVQGTTNNSQIAVTHVTYNAQGLQEKVYLPYRVSHTTNYVAEDTSKPKTTYAYDALGRVTTVTNPDGTQVLTTYDTFTTTIRDENSHQKAYENDAFGRLKMVWEYTGTGPSYTLYATTQYAYYVTDLLYQVIDAASNTTTLTYDAMGRKTQMVDPDMGTWYYKYDDASNLLGQKDAENQCIWFRYDALNRLIGKKYSTQWTSDPGGNAEVTYTYDDDDLDNYGNGLRTSMTQMNVASNITVTTEFQYDARGRLWDQVEDISGEGEYRRQWTYNSADQVVTQVYPYGNTGGTREVVTTGYDVWGRPYSLSSSYGTTYVTSATYDALGRLDLIQFGNGYRTDYNYYSATTKGGRLQEIKSGTSGTPDAVQRLVYDYDNAGNVYTITDYKNSSQVQTFTYDELDRLTQAQTNAVGAGQYTARSYTYYPNGSIYWFESIHYGYNDNSHKHAVTHVVVPPYYEEERWRYDANGNMEERYWNSAWQRLTYDYENRLVTITDTLTLEASFAYDADGNRVWQDVNDTETHYVWDWVESGANYYYFGGRKVAMRTGTITYLCGDHLTSTVETNDSGANLSQLYYPYGAERRSGSLPTPYRYTGQRWESAIGLYFYNARWYDAALGRFIQPDTIVPEPGNPQALNRYSYVLNNPVKYTDPSGHWIQLEDASFSQDYGFQFGPFGVRYASDGQLRILHGGQRFRNCAEVALGNYALSGGNTQLPDFGGANLAKAANYALREVSGEAAGDSAVDPMIVIGLSMAFMKAVEGDIGGPIQIQRGSRRPPVVIGENVQGRIIRGAAKYGAERYQPGPGVTDLMEDNRAWVRQMMAEGREFIDLGPDFGRRGKGVAPSPFYGMERQELKGYANYAKAFDRYGKYRGGVPGLD